LQFAYVHNYQKQENNEWRIVKN